MGASRPSLRETLRALSIAYIIDNHQGSDTFVTFLEPERLIEHLDVVLAMDDATIRKLFSTRANSGFQA